jgi:hypothetical protein
MIDPAYGFPALLALAVLAYRLIAWEPGRGRVR